MSGALRLAPLALLGGAAFDSRGALMSGVLRLAPLALLLACAGPALGCAGPAVEHAPVPLADLDVFRERVMPHLARQCGSGGCHGRPDRPLALYVPGAHREDPARTFLDAPLDAAELEANARRISAFALGVAARDSLAVRKPLALEAGGAWHLGGEIYLDDRDPGCHALVEWLDARVATTSRDGGLP